MKPVKPSPELAKVVGEAPGVRTEIVSRLWQYIRAHDLQDKTNKRMINPDDALAAVTGKDQISMFQLSAAISKHLSPG